MQLKEIQIYYYSQKEWQPFFSSSYQVCFDNKINNMLTNTEHQPKSHRTLLTIPRRPQTKCDTRREVLNHSSLRPGTTPLYHTLNVTGQSQWVGLHSIDVAQDELQETYRGQMCGYLRKKFRRMVGKHQEAITLDRYSPSPEEENPENKSHASVGPLDQFYSTFHRKSRVHAEKGVEGAVLNNAKEKIVRLIQKKRQQREDFKDVNRSIRVRRENNNHRRGRSLREQFTVPIVENQEWDRSWRDQTLKQKVRYRNRLLLKTNRELCTLALVDFSK